MDRSAGNQCKAINEYCTVDGYVTAGNAADDDISESVRQAADFRVGEAETAAAAAQADCRRNGDRCNREYSRGLNATNDSQIQVVGGDRNITTC